MNNVYQLKPRTKELHDTMRQIARSQQPSIQTWRHMCPGNVMDNINVQVGIPCPFCGVDEKGVYHEDGH